MPLHSYFVLLAFTTSGLILVVRAAVLKKEGLDLIGTPTVEKFLFYTGKIAIFSSWGFFMVKAFFPDLGYIQVPEFLAWIAICLLWAGTLIISAAFIHLGKSLKVGLPEQDTLLKTHGIYSFSRNPIYTGIIMIAIGSCLYFPDIFNILFTIYGIYVHHKIIKGEELFLSNRFGKEWETYQAHVRRYL